jgi:flagellar protein FlbD
VIELTQLNGISFSLNEQLIEIIESIPETKISLTNGRYYLVKESREEITEKIIKFEQNVFKHIIGPKMQPEE